MKTCLKYLFTLSMLMACGSLMAQQDPLYSQYLNNPFILNPAYAGLTNNLNLSLSYRAQWAGFEGSPKTINANAHMALADNRMGAGLMVISDQIGSSSVTEVFASYSYHLNINDSKVFSFGLQGGFASYQIDNTIVNPIDRADALFEGINTETKPSFGFGAILKSDKFFVGLSVPRMLKTTILVHTTLLSDGLVYFLSLRKNSIQAIHPFKICKWRTCLC
jgi:type IX secretion system PorP/SprF family membrane protein